MQILEKNADLVADNSKLIEGLNCEQKKAVTAPFYSKIKNFFIF